PTSERTRPCAYPPGPGLRSSLLPPCPSRVSLTQFDRGTTGREVEGYSGRAPSGRDKENGSWRRRKGPRVGGRPAATAIVDTAPGLTRASEAGCIGAAASPGSALRESPPG